MSTKTVYFHKVILHDTDTNQEVPISKLKGIFTTVFEENKKNGALLLSKYDSEPFVIDIIEDNDDYLFAKLCKKRLSNGMQKRDYADLVYDDVLSADEKNNMGVELFTYCIYGYKHGILSVAKSQGAPYGNALERILQQYDKKYYIELEDVPNPGSIKNLLQGESPEITGLLVQIPVPRAQFLEEVLGLNETDIIQSVSQNTAMINFEVRPVKGGSLTKERESIIKIIGSLMGNKDTKKYKKAVVTGKTKSGERSRSYVLYEQFFKYPIDIKHYHQVDGRRVEYDKEIIERDYRRNMMNIYDEYKSLILNICDR